MTPENPFGTTINEKARLALVKTFTKPQCLAAARMGGLSLRLVMAIESRLRRLAGTSGTSTRLRSEDPAAAANRNRAQRRRRQQRQGPSRPQPEP